MKRTHLAIVSTLLLLGSLSLSAVAQVRMTPEQSKQHREQEAKVYERMKRYGINREDMAEFRRLSEIASGHPDPQPWISANTLFKPSEHYRMEMDEFILTMKVPDAPYNGGRIWPYTTTRPLHPDLAKNMAWQRSSSLKVADFSWYVCSGVFARLLQGDNCPTAGGSIRYHILTPEGILNTSTPEAMSRSYAEIQKTRVLTQAEREQLKLSGKIDNRASNRIVLVPEQVVINGRIWVRKAMTNSQSYLYQYTTFLAPDRMIGISFGVPYRDGAWPDPNAAQYPPPSPKGLALIEELIASVRVAKVNDDGAPDPFVIQRVEPAPLPVREKRPAAE